MSEPVKREGRTWFGIEWYQTEEAAETRAARVLAAPHAPTADLGRHPTYDQHDPNTGEKIYAVIVS